MKQTTKIHCEITPLKESELFLIKNNYQAKFDYPVHYHNDYELNMVFNCAGKRIVGDSIEDFSGIDLVLIGPHIPHAWRSESYDDARVITIQFEELFLNNTLSNKKGFKPICDLLTRSKSGILFQGDTVKEIQCKIIKLIDSSGFNSVVCFYDILNSLAEIESYNYKLLASNSFDTTPIVRQSKSRRIEKICNFIENNYYKNITLDDIASLVNMSPSACSHFFKKRTSRTFNTYLTDIRIGYAAQMLIDTTKTIYNIAYDCGFGNISNFNRIFKIYKNQTPSQFRINASETFTKY